MFAPLWTRGRTYEIRIDRIGFEPVSDRVELGDNVVSVIYRLSVYPICLVEGEPHVGTSVLSNLIPAESPA